MAWTGGSGVAFVHPRLTNRGRACISRILRTAGWKEEQFWVCRGDDIPSNARALVAMGDEAQVKLTGWSGGKRAAKYTRGYELPSWTGRPVVPTFDPEQVVQGQWKLLSLMMHDVGVAMGAAMGRGGVVHDPKGMVDYKEGVGALRELVAAAKASPSALIAFDLETRGSEEEDEDETIEFSRDDEEGIEGDVEDSVDFSTGSGSARSEATTGNGFSRNALDTRRAAITTVQFSLAPGTGVSAEWSPEVKDLVQEIFDLPNQKISWNGWQFDEVVLRTHGINIPTLSLDLMWAWHFHQPDLPAHLQGVASVYRFPFPWKHMAGSDLSFYGCCDVDVLHWIYKGLLRDMQRMGTWEGYLNYVVAFRPLLNTMEQRGIPVSREKLAELREWLKVEIGKMDERLQVAVPREICLPEKKEPYKGIPNDAKAAIKLAHPAIVGLAKAKQGAALKALTLDDPIVRQCIEAKGYGIREGAVWKEDKLPFNPRSPLQILSYLRHQNYTIPKRFRDNADSTADKELERLEAKTGDEVIKLTRSIRAYSKMGNAYAGKVREDGQVEGGWYPGPDGRLRSTITYGPATGQLAARNPNCMTTPKRRAELAFKFRKCIEAEPGHKILEIDYRAFHARTLGREAQDPAYYRLADLDVHSFVAGHIVHHPGIETCLSMPDEDLRQYLGEIKKKHKAVRDFKAKPCIAEGELVLTDTGLKPIETVTLADKVWDGVEWVHHEGLICKGIKEIITYGGLRATPDHKVYTADGRVIPFRQAASKMDRLECTGDGRTAIRTGHNHFIEDAENKRLSSSEMSVPDLRQKGMDISEQLAERQNCWMSELYQYYLKTFRSVRTAIRCNGGKVSAPTESQVQGLWGSRNRAEVWVSKRVHPLGREELTSSQLQGGRDRSNRQRWALRARESEIGYSIRTDAQYSIQYPNDSSRKADSFMQLSESIRSFLDPTIGSQRNDWRTDNRTRTRSPREEGQKLGQDRGEVERVRVYDLVNAGPRHRYTVSGSLVSNCILGIGFKMGARRLYFENRDTMADEAEAKRLLDLIKDLFKPVFKWQDAICEEADRKHHLINAWGAIRWAWDIFKWQRIDGEWRRSSSRDAEKVVAFLPSSNAHYMLRDKLMQLNELGLLEKYGFILPIHDALLFHCPDQWVDEATENIKFILESPVMQLADPVVAKDGFTCSTETAVGSNWASFNDDPSKGELNLKGMKEIK